MERKNKKQAVFIVEDLETLRVLTDALRIQILHILDREPQTVNQVAKKLGLSGSRLYYHFNLLEEHGLIEVVETRVMNNMIEKLFWVTADEIDINKELLNFSLEDGQENIITFILSSLESVKEDMVRSLEARKFNLEQGAKAIPRDMTIYNTKKCLKDVDVNKFSKRLKVLMEEFANTPDEVSTGEDINVYSFACYFYPSFYYEKDRNKEERKAE